MSRTAWIAGFACFIACCLLATPTWFVHGSLRSGPTLLIAGKRKDIPLQRGATPEAIRVTNASHSNGDTSLRNRVRSAGGVYDRAGIRFTLGWDDINDLDLAVTAPAGETIGFFSKRSSDGGTLDVDRNAQGDHPVTDPVENIVWPGDKGAKGEYRIMVSFFACRSGVSKTAYRLELHGAGKDRIVRGELSGEGDVDVYSFTVE
jgi:hypothetical protein